MVVIPGSKSLRSRLGGSPLDLVLTMPYGVEALKHQFE